MDEMRRMMLEQMQSGGAQQGMQGPPMQQPPQVDQGQQLQQRLQQRLNPRIGTMQDSDPQGMAQFMVQNDPKQAASMLAKVMLMLRGPATPPARKIGLWNTPELAEGAPGLHMEPSIKKPNRLEEFIADQSQISNNLARSRSGQAIYFPDGDRDSKISPRTIP